LFVVPASVAGRWTFRAPSGESFDVELAQTYQQVNGSAPGATVTGKLNGTRLELASTDGGEQLHLTGTVAGPLIAASVVRGTGSIEYLGTRHD
jgi:hypothetical protein